ncbi:MAG: efflux RND transporter periplasmic adaptor subunit [Thermoanaerobaculia bacterium]
MNSPLMRPRILVPTAVVALIAIIAVAAAFWMKGSGGKQSDPNNTSAAAAAATGKNGSTNGKEKEAVPVKVAGVAVAPVSSYLSATANLIADQEVKVIAEADGRVSDLLVDEGAMVRRGQPLVRLAKDDAEIAYTKARVQANNARVTFQRASEMAAKDLLSRTDYDKAKMEKEVAEQELAEAEWMLGKTIIRAPFDGRITERKVQLGQHVAAGAELFTLSDFDPLIAWIYLPERDVFGLDEGRKVRITLKADERIRFDGRIDQISPVVDTATGTVKLKVVALRPPAAVRPGTFVTIDIVRETHPKALLLPRESVIRELQEAHVFVADGATARKRAVSLGIEEGDRVEVLSGVRSGEKVIVAGQGGLKDGSPIRILPAT